MDIIILQKIKRIMVMVRFDIHNINNVKILEKIIKYLCINNDIKMFDIEIKNISNDFFELIKNCETNFLSDKCIKYNIKVFMLYMIEMLINSLNNNMFDKAYDIADVLQGLPDYEFLYKKRYFKKYWKVYIMPYIKKYNDIKLYNLKRKILEKNFND